MACVNVEWLDVGYLENYVPDEWLQQRAEMRLDNTCNEGSHRLSANVPDTNWYTDEIHACFITPEMH